MNTTTENTSRPASGTDVAEVARKLSPAMRDAITCTPDESGLRWARPVTAKALEARGLAIQHGTTWFALTNLGRAVHAVLTAPEPHPVTEEMAQVLRSANPMNGLVTVYVRPEVQDAMVAAELLYACAGDDEGDLFLDHAGIGWLSEHPRTESCASTDVHAPHNECSGPGSEWLTEPMRQQPQQQHQARAMFDLELQQSGDRLEIGLADPSPELTGETAEQRVCVTCEQPINPNAPGSIHYEHTDNGRFAHIAQPKLAHPMDNDPFAGLDEDEASNLIPVHKPADDDRELAQAEPVVIQCPDQDPHADDGLGDFHEGDIVRNRKTGAKAVVRSGGAWFARFYELVSCRHEPAFPTAEPEPSMSLAQFQQRVAAGEWSGLGILGVPHPSPSLVKAAVDAEIQAAVLPEYFVAPDGYGDPALWRRSSDPERPEAIVSRPALDTLHEDLWPAVVTHFTSNRGR